ncbi:unnamed protein product [Arctia plantaginis]|uniref:Uncharacterized protein n=1 Tax=Arctia plantaginis TaxID=874455 RepID=A0A8S0Z8A0_ARCPL|nr:unnamed protein product [Arctia plantaginis]
MRCGIFELPKLVFGVCYAPIATCRRGLQGKAQVTTCVVGDAVPVTALEDEAPGGERHARLYCAHHAHHGQRPNNM